MGNDGSGKTTIAKKLVSLLEEVGCKVLYKHEYDYSILPIFFKIFGKRRLENNKNEFSVKRIYRRRFYFWPFLVWLDKLLQLTYFRLFHRNTVVILDRYIYDHYMTFKYLGYITNFTEWLYLKFPQPDVAINLWIDAEIAYERKKDTHTFPIDFYQKQTERYLELAKKLRLKRIKTDQPSDQTIREILCAIIKKAYQIDKPLLSKISLINL